MRVHLGEIARRDVDLLWDYCFFEFGGTQADILLDRIYGTMKETTGAFPDCGRLRPEFGRGVRSFPVLPYILFYRVEPRRTTILRVLHGRRDLNGPLMSLMLSA